MIKETEALEELGEWKQWLMWKRIDDRKRPFSMYGHSIGTVSTYEKKWAYYADVKGVLESGKNTPKIGDPSKGWDGIGFVFTEDDPYVGIDIDKCVDEDGKIMDWAAKLVKEIDSYTEWSPSGTGVHIIAKGNHIRTGHNPRGKEPVEMYSWGRYFTFNGNHIEGTPTEINERHQVLEDIEKRLYSRDPVLEKEEWKGIDFQVARSAMAPAEKLKDLLKNVRDFRVTWKHTRTDMKEKSMSELDAVICRHMIEDGWEPWECAAGIIQHRRDWSKGADFEKAMRVDYIGRTWSWAKATIDQGMDIEESLLQAAKDAGGDDALVQVSAKLGVIITQFIKRGDVPCQYLIKAEGVLVALGEVGDLTVKKVRNKVLDATGRGMTRVKDKHWDKIVDILMGSVEKQEIQGTGEVGEVMDCLNTYLEARNVDTEDFKQAFQINYPYKKKGEIYFHKDDFIRYLNARTNLRYKPSELSQILVRSGWEQKQCTENIDGYNFTRQQFRRKIPDS